MPTTATPDRADGPRPGPVPRTLVVLGAGPALGRSIARRFGRAGFAVGLAARRRERVQAYASELVAEGIDAAGFVADVTEPDQVDALFTAVEARFGTTPEVVYWGPGGLDPAIGPIGVDELTPETLRPATRLIVDSPITVVRRALPAMLDRGSGTLLFAVGASAENPMPMMANLGLAGAALDNYLRALEPRTAGTGVHIGRLTIGALIERGEVAQFFDANPGAFGDPTARIERVDPDTIAEAAWQMYDRRDTTRVGFGSFGSSPTSSPTSSSAGSAQG